MVGREGLLVHSQHIWRGGCVRFHVLIEAIAILVAQVFCLAHPKDLAFQEAVKSPEQFVFL